MKDKIDTYIDRVRHLPPAPTLLLEMMELLKKPDRDIDQVVKAISYDPSLTAEVLRRCNSAFFSGSRPAADIFEAVMNLGLYEIYRTVVVMFGSQAMAIPGGMGGISVEKLWRHSAATAVAAGIVAEHIHEPEGAAFTAGLLHDVGKVVLASADGSRYAQLVQASGTCGLPLLAAEQECFGFDHSEVGARLLNRWGLPENIVAAVRHHHVLAGAEPYGRSAAIGQLANLMAHRLDDAAAVGSDGCQSSVESMEALGLTVEEVCALAEQTEAGLKRVQGLMEG
jgi:putative nucleotidyltransferase with HDIG domain